MAIFKTYGKIFSQYDRKNALRLSYDYTRLTIKEKLLADTRGVEQVLGFSIEYPNRKALMGLLADIFFKQVYAVEHSTKIKRIIDAGANIGVSMLYFAWKNPEARIICFEPNLEAVEFLKENIERNHLTNRCSIEPYALGKQDGTTTFYVDEKHGASTGASQTKYLEVKKHSVKEVKVPVRTLSTFINEPIDILKIDIEGAEGDVLEELESTGKLSLIQRIMGEYHFDERYMTYPMSTFLALLERNGFDYAFYPTSFDLPLSEKPPLTRLYVFNAWRR